MVDKKQPPMLPEGFARPQAFLGLSDSASSIGIDVLQGVLGLISIAYPPAAPIITIIEKAAPYIAAAEPVIAAAISEGPSAFAAVKAQAPQLAVAIQQISDHFQSMGKTFADTSDGHVENVTRAIFRLPQMTAEQERQWMDSTTANTQDSRFGG